MTPIHQLDPNQPTGHIYRGGSRIAAFRGTDTGDDLPEDWVASTVELFGVSGVGRSRLGDGSELADRIAKDPESWLGPDHVKRWGTNPALLVKLLDAGERLPVHVHPDDAFASELLQSAFGKTEAWVALGPVTARMGFVRDISEEELADWVRRQDHWAMLDALHHVELAPGDSVVVPAGTVHALDAGSFIVELQQPTDFSILLEWETFGLDGTVDGHLGLGREVALRAVDRSATADVSALIQRAGHEDALAPAADGFFRATWHHAGGRIAQGYGVVVITEGEGTLTGPTSEPIEVKAGQTLVVPWSAGELALGGSVTALVCRPPAAR